MFAFLPQHPGPPVIASGAVLPADDERLLRGLDRERDTVECPTRSRCGNFWGIGLDERTPDHVTISRDAALDRSRDAPDGFQLGVGTSGSSRTDQAQHDWRDFDDAGSERGDEFDSQAGHRREPQCTFEAVGGSRKRGSSRRGSLAAHDRKRQKKNSNEKWASPADREPEITNLKDGGTTLAYEPKNTVRSETEIRGWIPRIREEQPC